MLPLPGLILERDPDRQASNIVQAFPHDIDLLRELREKKCVEMESQRRKIELTEFPLAAASSFHMAGNFSGDKCIKPSLKFSLTASLVALPGATPNGKNCRRMKRRRMEDFENH